jgi:hypothetical protein
MPNGRFAGSLHHVFPPPQQLENAERQVREMNRVAAALVLQKARESA